MGNGKYEIDDAIYKDLPPSTIDLMFFKTFNAYRLEDQEWKKKMEADLNVIASHCQRRRTIYGVTNNVFSLVGGIIGGVLVWTLKIKWPSIFGGMN